MCQNKINNPFELILFALILNTRYIPFQFIIYKNK